MKTLGQKLRSLRIEKSWTQEDIAHDLNMSLSAYSNIERDKTDISLSRLEQLAKLFKMTVIELLNYGTRKSDELELYKQTVIDKDKEIQHLQKKLLLCIEEKEVLTKRLIKIDKKSQ